jgi:glycerophosphoryl diester phosphodiesterase
VVAHGLRKRVAAVIVVMLVSAVAVPVTVVAQPEATLEGRAVLQADTFAEGPQSGNGLEEETKDGRTPPFEDRPVGGISAVLDAGDGEFQTMPDNGFGKKDNSSDFQLRTYRIDPDFETANG